MSRAVEAPISGVRIAAYTIPTDRPESDGTLEWDRTTMIVAQAEAGGARGLGYAYAHLAAAPVAADLVNTVVGRPACDVAGAWRAMRHALRNAGVPGIGASAIAAVDTALWDLKARLLDVPLATLLGGVRDAVPAYGSGGFTSYSIHELQAQLAGWAEAGLPFVKMKVGRDPAADVDRVRAAREAIGPSVELFVDANGAHHPAEAILQAHAFARHQVTWFEEPVTSDDLRGLREVRRRSPDGMRIAAGEYGYTPEYFRRMVNARAVDVLQADATRCGGISGLLTVGALCETHALPLSAHTAPSLHTHPCCALAMACHVEYFHDHARIEQLLFDGAIAPGTGGLLRPDRSRPGLGLELRRSEAAHFAVWGDHQR